MRRLPPSAYDNRKLVAESKVRPDFDKPIYDIASFYPGRPTGGALILRHVLARDITFPENLEGSQCSANVNPTSDVSLIIRINGTQFALIQFNAGHPIASFSGTQVSGIAGDILTIENQSPADATLADISTTIMGDR